MKQIKNLIYNYEQQIINSINYCPYECCDGFLHVIIFDYISNDLMCYVSK